jgi:hypothetical protein
VTVADPYCRAVSARIAGLISGRRRRGSIFSAVSCAAAGSAIRHGFASSLILSGPKRLAKPRAGEDGQMSMATDVVDAQIEAYRAKDVERFLSHYADDASVVLFDGTPMFADKQAMREQYGKLFADSPDLHLTVASRMTAGDFVVDEEHVSGIHFGDMPTQMTALSVYRVTNGKITRLMLLF